MFIERDKEKECNEVSSLRHHMRNYYEIHRTNLFGVNRKTRLFFFELSLLLRMLFNHYKMLHQQHGKILFGLVLLINKD